MEGIIGLMAIMWFIRNVVVDTNDWWHGRPSNRLAQRNETWKLLKDLFNKKQPKAGPFWKRGPARQYVADAWADSWATASLKRGQREELKREAAKLRHQATVNNARDAAKATPAPAPAPEPRKPRRERREQQPIQPQYAGPGADTAASQREEESEAKHGVVMAAPASTLAPVPDVLAPMQTADPEVTPADVNASQESAKAAAATAPAAMEDTAADCCPPEAKPGIEADARDDGYLDTDHPGQPKTASIVSSIPDSPSFWDVVAPITEEQMSEITGLTSGLAYMAGFANSAEEAVRSLETTIASLEGADVSGPVIENMRLGQEHQHIAGTYFNHAHAALAEHIAVRESYVANPGAGSKDFVTSD